MRNSKRQSWLILISAACMLVASPALAQDGGDRARSEMGAAEPGGKKQPGDSVEAKARKAKAADLYKRGKKAAARGDKLLGKRKKKAALSSYGTAAGLFLQAYRTVDNPLLLYVLGQVYQSRGENEWAKQCYERYLERDPQGQKIAEARKKIVKVGESMAAGTDKPETSAESVFATVLDPEGVCYDKEVEPPLPPPPPPKPVDTGKGSKTGYRIGFFASAGVSAGAGATALVTLLQIGRFESAKDDAVLAYQSRPGNPQLDVGDVCSDAEGRLAAGAGDPDLQAISEACSSGKSRAMISNIMHGVTVAALLATGFFMYKAYIQKSGPKESGRATLITPTVTRDTVGAQVLWRF